LTNEMGIATVRLFAGSSEGAGTLNVSVDGVSSAVNFSVTNPIVVNPVEPLMLTISLSNDAGDSASNIDGANALNVSATFTENGVAVANKKVEFQLIGGIGELVITSALTNNVGIATIKLSSGSTEGAGTISASVGGTTASIDFSVTNPVIISPIELSIRLLDDAGQSTLNVSSASPVTVQALLTQNGVLSAGVKVNFALSDGIGELKVSSALTNEQGIASLVLYSGLNDGAGTLTASIDAISSAIDFAVTVSVNEVSMSEITTTPDSIGPNGTATISVTISEMSDGQTTPFNQSVVVAFTSTCSQLNKAVIDTDISTINGVAIATYKDNGCGVVDDIFVTSTVGQTLLSKTSTLTVQAANLSSIQFKEVSPSFIALRGTGGAGRTETSRVTFIVFDGIGNIVSDTLVNFELTTLIGGITISPETQAKTDTNGEVDVIVTSGDVATAVRVIARLDAAPAIATVSGELSISTGIADQNSFSLSASQLNPEAWNIDGVEVDITARLGDHFNNQVPDGTTVNFTTEFGIVSPSCSTINGVCSVKWSSQSPRVPDPAYRDVLATTKKIGSATCTGGGLTGLSAKGYPCFYDNRIPSDDEVALANDQLMRFGGLGQVYGNRITIFAHVIGEESFTDSNGNGQYDENEAYSDLSEAFRDDNEDGVFGGR
ncbi:MAG: hypothetical protein HRU25_18120, partial [Psychrobium sp.]|nr:hypothetical protein [Psychrobium sp.]